MLEFYAKGQELQYREIPRLRSGSRKYITAKFNLSSDWDGITEKWATFVFFERKYKIYLDANNEITEDKNLVLPAGDWDVSLVGVNEDGKKITTGTIKITVAPSGEECGNAPLEIPPTESEQLSARMSAVEAAEEVREGAETARRGNETGRAAAEGIRNGNEIGREENETERQENENARKDAERERAQGENGRVESEQVRQEGEADREIAEGNRTGAENTRQSNEASRQLAETGRQEIIAKIDGMTASAQTLTPGSPATAIVSEAGGVKHITIGVPTGATGAKGDKGDTGGKGETGGRGETGAKGDKGDKGDPGTGYTLTESDREDIAELVGADQIDAHNTDPTAHAYKADKLTTYTSGNILVAGAGGIYADSGIPLRPQINSWAEVQRVVRAGAAPNIFSIGEQLTCNRGSDVLVWDIIDFDHDTPANPHLTHSMSLQMHDAYKNIQFSAPQALYYAEIELPAGTYNFMLLAGYDIDYGGGKTYSFTLAQPIPAGGQIIFPWGYQVQAATVKISTYPSSTSATAIESNIGVTEGTSGTPLAPTNHTHRIRYGSNNWQQSALRQWLNSSAPAGNVWTPKTIYDRPPTWVTTEAGFLNGLDADFLAVVGAVKKRTALNTVTDGGGYIDTDETVFLPGRGEVGGTNEGGINEGIPYQYYEDMLVGGVRNEGEIAARIKYMSGTARIVWLRSPYVSNAYIGRYVYTSGAVNSSSANSANGVPPLVNIV